MFGGMYLALIIVGDFMSAFFLALCDKSGLYCMHGCLAQKNVPELVLDTSLGMSQMFVKLGEMRHKNTVVFLSCPQCSLVVFH